MFDLNGKPGSFATNTGRTLLKPAHIFKKVLALTVACTLGLTLSTPSLANAEELLGGEQSSDSVLTNESVVNTDATQSDSLTDATQSDGLEIGPEIIGQQVRQSTLETPTILPVFVDATTISGGKLHRERVNGKVARGTVYVTLKDKNGNEKATVSVSPKSGSTWKVNLPAGVTVAEGDTVTAYQTFNGATSAVATANAQSSMAVENKDKLTMPAGEIWIEHTNANLVNQDELAEAIEMLKKANPSIAGGFKTVKFSIDGTEHAYYEVTYTDGSTSGKVEAPDLIIKQVTETSAAPTIEKVRVTDGQIIVTLAKEVAAGTRFYLVKNFTDGEEKNFSQNGNCTVDKSNSEEMSQAVSIDGKTVTFPIKDDVLELKREFGVIVKESHKFRSCEKSEPVITPPAKVAVRDPKNLTDADKEAIDKAIRDANTVNGVSKLPDGTGFVDDPAFIEFDKEGNVTIISPNDVEVDWDDDGNPVYTKNPDGTYKLASGKENNVIKIPAKDLVKNIAPASPAIAVDTNIGTVTITPPAYENPGDDTDLASYTFTYTDASGLEKTVTATRTVDKDSNKTTWTAGNATVDANTGVITLSVEDIEVGGTIKATAKDNGGLEGDEEKLDSDAATKTLETATVSYDANNGAGEMDGKKLNKGSKYKILSNAFTAPDNEKFKTWKIGETEYAAGDEITVKEDTSIQAVWQDIEVKVSYDPNDGSGDMTGKTLKKGSKYTLLESSFTAPDETQEFKAWEVNGEEVAPGTEITVNDNTVVKALWKKSQVSVSYDGNGGSGEMATETVDKGSKYAVLPNGFTAPDETQEFKAWEVNGEEVAPGTEITVNDNTVVKALWKKSQVDNPNGGSNNHSDGTVDASKPRNITKLPSTGYAGMPYQVAAMMILAAGGLLIAGWKKSKKY